jgi:hypothetical protein
LYSSHDVTSVVRPGQVNAVGVEVGNGWWNPNTQRLFARFAFREVSFSSFVLDHYTKYSVASLNDYFHTRVQASKTDAIDTLSYTAPVAN